MTAHAIAMVLLGLFAVGTITRNPVLEELEARARQEPRRADEERMNAEQRVQAAHEEARLANENRRRAEDGRRQAESERRRADEARETAEEQRDQAEEDYMRSQVERMRAERMSVNARMQQAKAEKAKADADRRAAEAQAALEEVERALKEGIRPIVTPTPAEVEATKERLHYMEGKFHFAVSGISGSGKSSLINALRGVRNNDKGPLVARTGVVETTREIIWFADPNEAKPFVWYDIPGAGTLDIPDWQYFNDQGLYVFDAIIILIDNRFMKSDEAILRNCARFNIPAYIVRSKSRQHIINVLEDMVYEGDEEEDDEGAKIARARNKYITETRESVAHNLDRARLRQQKVYMVDKVNVVRLVRGQKPQDVIDELDLLNDLSSEAYARRVKPQAQEP